MDTKSKFLETESSCVETGVGVSHASFSHTAGVDAAHRALSSIGQLPLSVVIVYASVHYKLDQVLAGIREAVGNALVIGTTTAGEICGGAQQQSVCVVAIASPYLSAHAAIGSRVSDDWRRALIQATESAEISPFVTGDPHLVSDLASSGKALFAMIFYPGNTRRASSMGYEIVETFKEISLGRIPVFGGASADDWHMEGNSVFLGEAVHADSLLVAIFETQLEAGISISHGFQPIGQKLRVTAIEGHELLSLNQAPAAEVLAASMGSSQHDLEGRHVTLATGYPVGVVHPLGLYSVNVATYLTPGGGVRLTQPVNVGAELTLLAHDAESSPLAGQDAVRKAMIRAGTTVPSLFLVHYCALRPRILSETVSRTEIDNLVKSAGPVPLAGFFSFGEDGVADDGVSRHNNGAVAVLVLGSELSATARVALENRRFQAQFDVIAHADSESLSRVLFDNSPTGMVAIDPNNGHIVQANEYELRMLGYSAGEMLTKTVADVTHPEDRESTRELYGQLANGSTNRLTYEKRFIRKDGSTVWAEVNVSPLRDIDGKVCLYIGNAVDITERKRAQIIETRLSRANRLSSRCGSTIVHAQDEQALLNDVCQLAVETGGYLMAWIGFAENDAAKTVRPAASCGYEAGYLDNINVTWSDDESGQGPVGTAIRTSTTTAIQDVHTNPRMVPWREAAIKRGYQSCISLPLIDNKRVIGVLSLYSAEPYSFDADEVNLLEELASDLSFGIQTLRERAERVAAQSAFKRESEKTRVLLHNASDGIHILDYDGNLIEVSDSFCAMLGYSREEMMGLNLAQWDAGFTDTGRLWATFRNQFKNPVRSEFQTRHRRKDGTIFDVEVSGFPLELDGKPVLFNSSRDITERKLAEAELHKIQSNLISAQSLAHIGSWEWNVLENTAYWSDETYNIFGLPHRHLDDHRKDFLEIVCPADRQMVDQALTDALAGIKKYDLEYEICLADGTNKVIHVLGEVSRNSEGKPLLMRGTVHDITDRKQAEKALQESEQRLSALLDTLPVGVSISTVKEGKILEVNRAGLDLMGRGRDDVIGKTAAELGIFMDADDRARLIDRLHREGRVENFEVAFRAPTGQMQFHLLHAKLFRLGGEELIALTRQDVTERKKADAETKIAATAFESQEGMVITDADNVILRVNRAFTEITGYTPEEAIGRNPRMLSSGRQNAKFYKSMWEDINRSGGWEGEIWNRRKSGEIYPEHLTITAVKDQDGMVTNYIGAMSDITQRKNAEEEIKRLAFFDPLTHLPNRRLLLDRLQQAFAYATRNIRLGAIMFIDLDNFKNLNDSLGHDFGDLLLQQVAHRLSASVREGDTVARLGGDEFVVMLEFLSGDSMEAAAQTEVIGEKILVTLSQPYQLASHEFRCTASVGITLFGNKPQSTDELMKQADIALYQAKKGGRNTLRFFDPEMQDTINAHAALEGELHKALEKREFQLFYQVQVDRNGRALGAEALIRWRHPKHGLVSPAQFVQLAEDTGLILPIGLWVLDTACAQLKAWQRDESTRNLVLAVNVSAKQFRDEQFVRHVQSAVQRHDINPPLLKLELTESLLLEDIELAIEKMRKLKEFGVRISLDDFGTGYSSLFYLKRLPLDQIKIDQSFVRNIATDRGDIVMVRTIVELGMNFELDIVAEGLETETQFELLNRYGCSIFQGYLFSKPVPIEQFETLVKNNHLAGTS